MMRFEGAVPRRAFQPWIRSATAGRPPGSPGQPRRRSWSLRGGLLHGNDVDFGVRPVFLAELAIDPDHLPQAAFAVLQNDHVRQEQRERPLPAMSRAHHTACPRPFGSCWRVKLVAPGKG